MHRRHLAVEALFGASAGAALWVTVGVGAACVVISPRVSVYAVTLFWTASPIAAFFGALQALWLYCERDQWGRGTRLARFGALSGTGFGLLAVPPVYAQTTVQWRMGDVWLFLLAGAVGGGLAGWLTARRLGSGLPAGQGERGSRGVRVLLTAVLLFPGLAVLEYLHYGPTLARKLPVPALAAKDVLALPAGNARGSRWSGTYRFEVKHFESSGFVGQAGGTLELVQDDGRLTILDRGEHILTGGIDADGRFWAGYQRWSTVPPPLILRQLITGRFLDEHRFICSIRETLVGEDGVTINTIRSDGGGARR